MVNFVEELRWRGMLHDIMPGTEDKLKSEMIAGYIGFDPTADSLHVGSLAQIMTLIHFQRAGHKPFVLVGGATGMVGDPSGKSQERNLLSGEELQHNVDSIQKQLEKFLDFNTSGNGAEIVNNYDWFKNFSFLDFIRDVGKHITVNYMMAKDSVKKRLEGETGMSFTEFSYQLVQGYDFFYLWKEKKCLLQMGGSDQWGNIVTGTELIRRKAGGEAYALTTPLIKKADGTKFGKTEGGNIWLDASKTSPYQFYQFWLNASDEDAKSWIKIFTLLNQQEINALIAEHEQAPHLRVLQKTLAKELTIRVHTPKEFENCESVTAFLFSNNNIEALKTLSADGLKTLCEVIDHQVLNKSDFLKDPVNVVEFLFDHAGFNSKSEIKKLIQGGGIKINDVKVANPEQMLTATDLINEQYLLMKKGKNTFYLFIMK